jgi:tetratricopeptide (TPR) repeat protein
MLVIGLMVGLVLGYVFAERQAIPPAASVQRPAAAAADASLPEGHPPVDATAAPGGAEAMQLARQAKELEDMLAQSPNDPRIMVALGNLYFDAGRWPDARLWYERALEIEGGDPNVITDLAVVYRNLKQFEKSLDLLRQAIDVSPEHWQAWYNSVVVLHFDLHRHDEAVEALDRLKELAATNPQIPDLTALETEVRGS